MRGNRLKNSNQRYFTLLEYDVGKPTVRAFGHTWLVQTFMGQILPGDVGKRVYLCGGILQVENNEQREVRRKNAE